MDRPFCSIPYYNLMLCCKNKCICNQGRICIISDYSFDYEYVTNLLECINENVASKIHCKIGFGTVLAVSPIIANVT